MKLKECSFIIVLILMVSYSYGQSVLTGTVKNDEGLLLNETEIYIEALGVQTISDSNGVYKIDNIPDGTYTLIAFAFEYQIFEQEITINSNTVVNITLEPLGVTLSEVVLTQRRERIFALKKLRKVEGTAIYAGKKSEVVLVDQITGNLAANNARQIYSQVVGLNIYDNGDAGLQLNIGGRGLDPNRTANFNTRQNGYDISADVLGYPESYYTPPAEALSEIQVVRGAASLQYGTQFGGFINFKFKPPSSQKKVEWITRQSLGSFGLKTSFNSLSGTIGNFSYYSYFNYKEGDGFRPNSNYNSRNYHGHFAYKFNDKTKLIFEATLLNYLAKQAGGLTDAQFIEDPTFSNRARNWFKVDWNLFSLRLEHQLSQASQITFNLFALDASRKALGFRTNRVSQPDDLEEPRELLQDDFKNWGAETRWITRYKINTKDAVLLLGAKYYQTDNEQRQGPGSVSGDPDFRFRDDLFPNYERQSQFELPNLNLALFGEHIFNISNRWSVTPGFRFEYIKTETKGSFRNIILDLAGNPLLNEEIEDNRRLERNFLLLGVGSTYNLSSSSELYGNFSQNYRSVTFNDIRVVNPSFQVDPNIGDEQGFTADLGIRGRVNDFISFDASIFGLLYDDRLGEVLKNETRLNALGELIETGRVIRFRGNIGTAFIYGIESFGDWNLKKSFFPSNENLKLNYFVNAAFTKSEYTASEETNVKGNEVEFIPKINLKTGFSFGYKNFLASLQYTYLSKQFTDATNAPQDVNDNQRGIEGAIPSYDILDFSASYTYKKWKLEAGINNLLNTNYFTRRATGYPGPGIIPAEPRTIYTTLQFKF